MKNLFLIGMVFGSLSLVENSQAMEDVKEENASSVPPVPFDWFKDEPVIVAKFHVPADEQPQVPAPAPSVLEELKTTKDPKKDL